MSLTQATEEHRKRYTLGELRAPLIPCQIAPPTAPMAKAPPKSLSTTHGLEYCQYSVCRGIVYVPWVSCVVCMGHARCVKESQTFSFRRRSILAYIIYFPPPWQSRSRLHGSATMSSTRQRHTEGSSTMFPPL